MHIRELHGVVFGGNAAPGSFNLYQLLVAKHVKLIVLRWYTLYISYGFLHQGVLFPANILTGTKTNYQWKTT